MKVEGFAEGGASAVIETMGDEIEKAEAEAATLADLIEAGYRLAEPQGDSEPILAVLEAAQIRLASIQKKLKAYLDREQAMSVN